jgi:hypothetical protein
MLQIAELLNTYFSPFPFPLCAMPEKISVSGEIAFGLDSGVV